MRLEKTIRGKRGGKGATIMSLLDGNPDAWNEYLTHRRINASVAIRRIEQLRASKTALVGGRKAEL
jgi:hypothetical protein